MDQQAIDLHKFLPKKKLFITIIVLIIGIAVASTIALANANSVIVKASSLNVRIGPGLSYDVMTQVNENQRLNVLDEENQWYKVRLSNDQVGWVAGWLVENDEITSENQKYGRVTGKEVNIRQYATTDSAIMGTVFENAELSILFEENDWYQVLYLGKVAWIHKDYVEVSESPSTVPTEEVSSTQEVVIGELQSNIRAIASTEGEILTAAEPNARLIYLGTEDDWYKVQLEDGRTGYVANWVSSLSNVDTVNVQEVEKQVSRAATNLSEAIIMIDPGHGGKDPGAMSSTGIQEKDIALSTAKILKRRLQDAGARVMLTRDDDSFISLNDRVYLSHKASADAYISIHFDAMEEANSMSGTTTYYYSESEKALADTVNDYLAQNGPLTNNGVRLGNYYVLRNNAQPSILLELGYLNNDVDISMVSSQSYQSTVVESIYQGLRDYFSN
ncbi:N-acetylmuramoyl-L-alanine amidase [Marinilactibacillus kalidii]|uniref:N-acetylmuramoyl-L-alanine amidase n=1 Tax=Marinilactibacillus kalidii TaxID=2820274 RepID=UPI001ABDF522|nr:N-acetylmuramoyl-L-alanine amidase [Marinilactibacillus kalidii]